MENIQITRKDHELLRSEYEGALQANLKSFFMKFETCDIMVELDIEYAKFLLGILDDALDVEECEVSISLK